MFNRAIHTQSPPQYRSSDQDPLYQFHQYLDVKEIKTVPYAPLSHPFVERLIGTIRREYLDLTLFWTAADLEEKLRFFSALFQSASRTLGLGRGVATARSSTGDIKLRLLPVPAGLSRTLSDSHSRMIQEFATNSFPG